ncbi:MAG: hypothetical protein HDR72_05130 [Ruminococcaceae bacterium]|nr:hypothetical protein [Oscillospiraceae bacterium]
MIRSYLFKLLHSPIFYLTTLAVFAVSLYSVFFGVHTFADILSEIDNLISFEFFRKMFVLLAALPFASNFANEWNSKTITNCVTRKNVVKYALDNAIICFLSAFASVFTGIMLCVLIRMPFKPLFSGSNALPPYGVLSENGLPMLAAFLIVLVYALSCAMWSVMSLAATAFFPSKYIAVCAPFVLSYLVERFTKFVPGEFQLAPLSQSWSGWKPLPAFLKSVIVFLVISLVCTAIFAVKVKRRVENELS